MLQAIRDGSKGTAAKIIVGVIVVTFALFGIDGIVKLGMGEDAPAEVNGEEISESQVQQMVQMQKRRLQAQFGENFDPSMIKDELLRDSAIESLVNETLLKQAATDAGVFFSNAAIDQLILQSPEFQVNGQFDRDRFDLVLRSAGFTRATYRELLRTSLSTQQTQSAWQATSFTTPYESQVAADLEAQTRDFSYITYTLADSKKNVQVSDEEIASYYESNHAQFMTEDQVKVKYIELKRTDLAKGISITEDEIAERYESLLADANSKKEYRAAHILLLSNDATAQDKLKEVKAKLANGESFEELAKLYSEDDTSKNVGGDLGFASTEIYEPAFADALTALDVNGVSDVIETRDGLHLIKLLETRQPEVAPLSELKDSIETALREEAVQVVYLEKLENLKDEAFSSTNLNVPSKSLDLEIKSEGPFAQSGGEGIAGNQQVVMAAFSDVVVNDGANSDVIEVTEGHAVVLHLDQFIESKVKPLNQVSDAIRTRLTNTKAAELLNDQVQEALSKAESGELPASWKSEKNKSRDFTGVDPQVLNKVFTMAMVDSNPSYALVAGRSGDQVLVRLDGIKRAENSKTTDDELQKVSRAKSYNEYKAYYQYQLETADIEKN